MPTCSRQGLRLDYPHDHFQLYNLTMNYNSCHFLWEIFPILSTTRIDAPVRFFNTGAEVKGEEVFAGIFFPKKRDLVRATLVNHEGKIDSKNSQISATSGALSLLRFSTSL